MALAVSLIVSYFLYNRIKKQYAASSQPMKIVAAAKPLDAGATITADAVALVDWPVNFPLEGALTKTSDAVGRIVVFPVSAKEPIRESLLAPPGTIGLTAKIPDGMRGVAVETNDVTTVSGFLYPGCHVDVLVTVKPDEGRQEDLVATVLQNIEVLSTGEKLVPDPSGKPQKVRTVTMLLSPDDSQKLVLAANKGTIQFVLRNGNDQLEKVQRPVQMKDLLAVGGQVAAPVAVKKAAPRPKPQVVYEVDTYDGTKKNTVKF